jgi:fumarate hydratase class I
LGTLGTSACPPYHIAIVIGGTSAETTMKTVKLASTKYYDELPTAGNEHGQAFRDLELEAKLLGHTRKMGYGAQFGGKYFLGCARSAFATSWRILPCRYRRLLLGRS